MAIEIQSYTPGSILTNEEIASWGIISNGKLLTPQAIFEKTGVRRRFIAGKDETVLDMAIRAVQGLQTPPSPDMVFFSTSYPDGVNNVAQVIERFNLQPDGCLNVHAACSGFGLALPFISERDDRFRKNQILVISSEKYSPTIVDLRSGQTDPSLAQTIFSDGATAMSFRVGEDIEILNSSNHTFPRNASDCLRMPINYDLVRHPALVANIPPSTNGLFWMDGIGVYGAIRAALPDLIIDSIRGAKIDPKQIRVVIPHQASRHMIDTLAKGLPFLDFYRDLEDGNWSSASIPKALAKAFGEGAIGKGDKLVLASFGAGLLASIAVIQLN